MPLPNEILQPKTLYETKYKTSLKLYGFIENERPFAFTEWEVNFGGQIETGFISVSPYQVDLQRKRFSL